MGRLPLLAVLLALGGCGDDDGGAATGGDMAFVPAFAAHDKVDILFMIDSSGTAPIQNELRNRVPLFVKALETARATHPASYHIGVVTADVGAGPYTLNNGQCHPDGDGGKLQVVAPDSFLHPVPLACDGFTLGGGVRFIDYDQVHGACSIFRRRSIASWQWATVGADSSISSSRCIARCTIRSRRTPAFCARTRCSSSSSSPTRTTARHRLTAISSIRRRAASACTARRTRSAARSSASPATTRRCHCRRRRRAGRCPTADH